MLKRQRAPSPSPSLNSDMPLGEPLAIDIDRRFKRRRIAPPPLDGTLRGWVDQPPPPPDAEVEMDDQEEWDGTEDMVHIDPKQYATYADVNKLLHDLHIAHQHRLLSQSIPTKHVLHHNALIPHVQSLHINPAPPSKPLDPSNHAGVHWSIGSAQPNSNQANEVERKDIQLGLTYEHMNRYFELSSLLFGC
ncbi:hypothetical protein AX16_005621 [Volvariella volvacea WC 439]|nr:hypothetical protein AX16_005621 [Volvariella volvacea WC 439]